MLKNLNDIRETKEILLAILSNSGTLAGISIALVGILNIKPDTSKINALADDLFLFSALGYVIDCYLVFFAIRQLESDRLVYWARVIDVIFLVSLTLQVLAGFLTVYTFV
jgi:hypothetical protein